MLHRFTLVHADRKVMESGKRKGGGLCVFNNKWCNPGHITVKEKVCNRDIELLAVCVWPHYIPQEFSHVIVITVHFAVG